MRGRVREAVTYFIRIFAENRSGGLEAVGSIIAISH